MNITDWIIIFEDLDSCCHDDYILIVTAVGTKNKPASTFTVNNSADFLALKPPFPQGDGAGGPPSAGAGGRGVVPLQIVITPFSGTQCSTFNAYGTSDEAYPVSGQLTLTGQPTQVGTTIYGPPNFTVWCIKFTNVPDGTWTLMVQDTHGNQSPPTNVTVAKTACGPQPLVSGDKFPVREVIEMHNGAKNHRAVLRQSVGG